MQQDCHPRTFWILIGVAIRLAQGLGLHRDGHSLGLSPFEAEMRRRLWWHIVVVDLRATELAGAGMSMLPHMWDTQLPLNVNDSDIEPLMASLPSERTGSTEMTFCLLRHEIGQFTQSARTHPITTTDPAASARRISDFEAHLETSYLRFCDPVVPLHILTTITARGTITKLKHRRLFTLPTPNPAPSLGEKVRAMPPADRAQITAFSLKALEYDNFIHSTRSTRRFLWHVENHFPWGALISLLYELSAAPGSELAEESWRQLEEFNGHHPEYAETRKVMHVIVGDLTLKAWAAREVAAQARGMPLLHVPPFVQRLRARKSHALGLQVGSSKPGVPQGVVGRVGGASGEVTGRGWGDGHYEAEDSQRGYEFSWDQVFTSGFDAGDMSLEPVNWSQWGDLLADLE